MAPILIDDSRIRSVGTYGPELNRELARISQHRIVRQDAINSVRDLWFLVYDDEDDDGEEDLYGEDTGQNDESRDSDNNVEDENTELQRAIELSLKLDDSPNGGDCSGSASMLEGAEGQQEDGKASHEIDGKESEDEAAQLDYAIAMSLQEDDDDPGQVSPVKESAPKKKAPYPCGTCKKYPSFPFSKKASHFRAIQLEANSKQQKPCLHYLAISYCWSSTSRAPERSYRVRVTEHDGTISERPNRAPDEIIDRAVELAKRTGIRLIWLDQECLPQDTSREQELGVQAMDLVYSRALVTGGLLESLIPSQAHLDSVMTVLNWSQSRDTAPQGMPRVIGSVLPKDTFINCLLEFLEMLAFDPWNQRAWTLQESFSATKDVILNIRMAAPFIIHAPWCFEGPAPPGNLYMVQREVDALIKASQEFFELAIGPFSTSQLVENPGETKSPVVARAEKVFRALKQLRPEMPTTSNPLDAVFVVGGGSSGPRYKCNAAVALSFLRTRFNHRPADRLAILANLCSYEVRLDTVVIENNFTSLTTCLFCLAYINNDLSLLVPEVYQCFQLRGMTK